LPLSSQRNSFSFLKGLSHQSPDLPEKHVLPSDSPNDTKYYNL
jgi:hypothetical protein